MRIWQICESYPPKYGGGAALVASDLSRALAQRGHDVRILTTESQPGPDYSIRAEHDHGIRIERVNLPYFVDRDPDGWELGLRRWHRHERRVAQLIEGRLERWQPDIVEYHTTRPFGEVGPRAIARTGIPVVAILHDAWFICPRLVLMRSPTSEPCSGPGLVKCLECMYSHYDGTHWAAIVKLSWRIPRIRSYFAYRTLRRRSVCHAFSAVVSHSRFQLRAHQPHIRGDAIYFPLGINLDGLPTIHSSRPHTPLRFGFFGGFQPIKGIWDVLDAAVTLKRDAHEFELHVWGPSGPDDEREIAKRQLEDCVHLRGMYQAERLWDAYAEIDVAVMATTVNETYPRVPLEARAVGAPSIAPTIGGLPEMIRHGIDGLLYKFRDPKDLEQQMRRILTEPNLFESLCAGLQPVIDTRTRGAALEAVYASILSDRDPAAAG